MQLNTNRFVMAALTSAVLAGFGCAHDHAQTATTTPPDDVVQRTSTNPDLESTSLVLRYDQGQYLLTQSDRSNLSSMVEKSNFDASHDRIEVAVWADRMPTADEAKLSKSEQKIADKRIAQIKNFLKTKYNITSAKFYNMAEGTNWVARAFNTRDAELKTLFSKEEAAPMSDKDFQIIKNNGAASSAVLVVTHK